MSEVEIKCVGDARIVRRAAEALEQFLDENGYSDELSTKTTILINKKEEEEGE